MTFNRDNTNTFHRRLYAGMLETITLLKRNNDQQEGTVRAVRLFECRIKKVFKSGEAIQGPMPTDHRTVWQIPRVSLEAAGVKYINVLDRIVDSSNRYWQPESPQTITMQLYTNYVNVECVRVDPPPGSEGV